MSRSRGRLVVSWFSLLSACILPVLAAPDVEAQSERRPVAGAARIARGKYLVTILACNDCHTPFKMGPRGPEPDMTRMLSGHPEKMLLPPPPAPSGPWISSGTATNTAYAGPWGITYATNLTPDENTGMGIWTEDMFVRAIKTGKHMGASRTILPPMPWPSYAQMTDEDLKSVYAYLRTIPKISNRVPEYQEPKAPVQP